MRIVRSVLAGVVLLLSASPAFSQCRDWTEAVAQSFLSRKTDLASLQQFAAMSPTQYALERAANERQNDQEFVARSVSNSPVLPILRSRLQRFYQIGAAKYGVQLDPQEVYVLPDMTLNAFATGTRVFVYQGILLYYLDPIQYLVRAGLVPTTAPPEVRAQLASRFNWRNDWESLDFVLAHEASHNLMAHIDEGIVESMRGQVQEFASDVQAARKAIAEGHQSPGLKHYFGQGLLTLLSETERTRQRVAREEEADAVGSDILRLAGFRADSGIQWLQRFAVLAGTSAPGWQAVVTSLFCSTHPNTPQRMANLQQNIACLQFSGQPCAKHVTYALVDRLGMIETEFTRVQQYQEETIAIVEGRLKSNRRQHVEIRPNPKDATIRIDGTEVAAGVVAFPVGNHVLWATREGYRAGQLTFAVFPDIEKATIQFQLPRCDKDGPC